MKFDELIELIKNGTFEPYMNLSIYFKDQGTEEQEAIEELAKKQGSAEYDFDDLSLYIEDIDSFFFYERHERHHSSKNQFRKNIADFLVKINKISEIESVNLCCVINLGN